MAAWGRNDRQTAIDESPPFWLAQAESEGGLRCFRDLRWGHDLRADCGRFFFRRFGKSWNTLKQLQTAVLFNFTVMICNVDLGKLPSLSVVCLILVLSRCQYIETTLTLHEL